MKRNTIEIRLPDGSSRKIEVISPPPSLQEFRKDWMLYSAPTERTNNADFFPCLNPECRGAGVIYDPEDPPDIIEGNKGRRRIGCPTCKKTGRSTKALFKAYYQKVKTNINERRAQEKTDLKDFKAALKKLTAREFKLFSKFRT